MYSSTSLNKTNGFFRSVSLQDFDSYKERESLCSRESVVTPEGTLLDYPDLELRRNPPNVEVDNKTHPTETIITIDSANRPGTLVEVVQCLTELNLMVRRAQISSDGGWFVDVFHVEESNGGKVIDHKKIETIKQVLKIEYESERRLSHHRNNDERVWVRTVLEISCEDRVGVLYELCRIIANAGLDIKSLAAWTQYNRGAIVIGALTETGPLRCPQLKALLKRDIQRLFGECGYISIKDVKGYIHHERRLHRLLLKEAQKCGAQNETEASPPSEPPCGPSPDSETTPEVTITDWPRLKYWRVTIYCRDRTKLLFDTLCTLADMDYEVYHASVVSHRDQGMAFQDFYIRPRFGEICFNAEKAKKLKNLLISSILRRAPHGLRVHILTMDQAGLLCRVAEIFKSGELRVTRAIVKCLTDDRGLPIQRAVHTFFLQSENGDSADGSEVVKLLTAHGGILATQLTEDRVPPGMGALQDGFAFNVPQWPLRYGLQESLSLTEVPESYPQSHHQQSNSLSIST